MQISLCFLRGSIRMTNARPSGMVAPTIRPPAYRGENGAAPL